MDYGPAGLQQGLADRPAWKWAPGAPLCHEVLSCKLCWASGARLLSSGGTPLAPLVLAEGDSIEPEAAHDTQEPHRRHWSLVPTMRFDGEQQHFLGSVTEAHMCNPGLV